MDKTILIVDDDSLFLSSIKDHFLLAHPEIQVETASDGVEALMILDAVAIDLVATDVRMPRMDGLELLASIVSAGLKVPVIVFSAFVDASLREEADLFGAFAVFNKPVDLAHLGEVIDSGLRGASGGEIKGISVAGFLQLLQMEGKSCRLVVRSGEKEGRLCFYKGELVRAQWGDIKGDEAAQAIVRWEPAQIKMEGDRSRRRRTVDMSLTHVLLAAAKAVDEEEHGALPSTEAPLPYGARPARETPPSPPALATADAVQETLEKLRSLQGFLAAALLRTDDRSCWTLGSIPVANLKQAAEHCAEALAAQETLLEQSKTEVEAGWGLSITLIRHFYLARRVGSKGVLLIVLNREVATFALAIREVAALCEQLKPAFLPPPRPIEVSFSGTGSAVGKTVNEAS